MSGSRDSKGGFSEAFLSMFGLGHREANGTSPEIASIVSFADQPAQAGHSDEAESVKLAVAAIDRTAANTNQTDKADQVIPLIGHAEVTNESYLAYHDPLTDLPNRRATEYRLEEALNAAKRSGGTVGVAFIDIDGFKGINDSFGHRVGDAVLTDIATRFRALARSSELVTRFGGDEFVVVYPTVAAATQLSDAVRRLQGAFDRPFDIDGNLFELSASIGIAQYPDDAASAAELITHADVAMYQAKVRGGSNVFWYSAELGEALSARREMLERLNDPATCQDMFLCYQPIVDVVTQQIVITQALLRWQHPARGLLNASDILRVAGQLPASVETWIVKTALAHLAAWTRTDAKPQVSISLSSIDEPTFKRIDEALEITGVDPKYLMIEIPEHVVSADGAKAIEFGNKCAERGVSVALAGFMGKLNISDLGRLPITAVKLAPQLIAEIQSDAASPQPFLLAAISVARSFGLTVIATGVECLAQQRWVQNARLDLMQGGTGSGLLTP